MGIREQGLWFRFILAALFIHEVKEMLLLKQLLKVEKLTAANTDASVSGLITIHLQHSRGRPLPLSRGASTCEELQPQKQEQGRAGLLQITVRKTQEESSIVPNTTPQILTVISLIFYKAAQYLWRCELCHLDTERENIESAIP